MRYFAYGSNMRRARLEQRVGDVRLVGSAALHGYRHAFAKRGADGTAKGTIVAGQPRDVVYGVLYGLTGNQLDALTRHEGGYRRVEVVIDGVRAVTFEALRLVSGLRPSADYVAHYVAGMTEHELPADYVAMIRRQAERDWQVG